MWTIVANIRRRRHQYHVKMNIVQLYWSEWLVSSFSLISLATSIIIHWTKDFRGFYTYSYMEGKTLIWWMFIAKFQEMEGERRIACSNNKADLVNLNQQCNYDYRFIYILGIHMRNVYISWYSVMSHFTTETFLFFPSMFISIPHDKTIWIVVSIMFDN